MLTWLKNQIIEPSPAAHQAPAAPSDPVQAAVGRQDRQGGDGSDAAGAEPAGENAASGGGLLAGLVGLVAGTAVAEAILSTGDDDSRSGNGPSTARGEEAGGGDGFAGGFGDGFAEGGNDG